MIYDLLLKDKLTITGEFCDGVISEIKFDEFLEFEERLDSF